MPRNWAATIAEAIAEGADTKAVTAVIEAQGKVLTPEGRQALIAMALRIEQRLAREGRVNQRWRKPAPRILPRLKAALLAA